MNSLMKFLFCALFVISLGACAEGEEFDCVEPKSATLSGTVEDNLTGEPIPNASVHFANFSLDAPEWQMTMESDSNGEFAFSESGCSISDKLLNLRSTSHDDYDGFAASSDVGHIKIVGYKTREFSLIFNNPASQAEDMIYFDYNFCLDLNGTCHRIGESEFFTSTGTNTMVIQIAEGVDYELQYGLNDNSKIMVILSQDSDQLVIDF